MADRFLLQPFRFGTRDEGASGAGAPGGQRNGVAVTDDPDRHLRDKIIAVLFTRPGERINAPRFGAGLDRRVFEPLSDLQLGALEYQVTQGLRRDVGSEIIVEGVDIEARGSRGELVLDLRYQRRSDRRPRNLEIVL